MEFVKLKTTYYNDLAIIAAGEAAEVLFTRGLAFAGEQETDGIIPTGVPERLCPTKTKARVDALVRYALWTVIPGGWIVTNWEKHQVLLSKLEYERASARERQSRSRANRKQEASRRESRVTKAVTHGRSSRTEVEVEVEDAAAAASDAAAAPANQANTPLPPALEILRAKLDARRLTVRWDKLTTDQHADIEKLIDTHGDGPLVHAALQSFRPDNPPAFAQAWLATWHAIPTIGRLAAVQPRCDIPGHTDPAGCCTQCASEQKAAR